MPPGPQVPNNSHCFCSLLFRRNEHFVQSFFTHNGRRGKTMTDDEESKMPVKHGTVFVNYDALNTWLRFGTLTPLDCKNGHRHLEGAELLRWAGQRVRSQKVSQRTKKA